MTKQKVRNATFEFISQLEYWNDGIVGSGRMGQWFVDKESPDKEVNK